MDELTMAARGNYGCPLCGNTGCTEFYRDRQRPYRQCDQCDLVFVTNQFQLTAEAEKAVYDQHQNCPEDAGYRAFLSRLATPLLERLAPGSKGLDFGSGPGPTLSVIFQEAGHDVALFDPYYANHPALLQAHYDFITSTEVVEHLSQPGNELQRLWAQLKPGGYLGLMTKLVVSPEAFASWHYKNDPTHISFFSKATFRFIGTQWGVEPQFLGDDVIIFRKA